MTFARDEYMAALAEIESSGNPAARGQMHAGMRAPAAGLFQLTPTTAEGLVRNYPERFGAYRGLRGPQILSHIANDTEAQKAFQDALVEDQIRFLDARRPGWQDRPDAADTLAIAHRFGLNQALQNVDGTLRRDRPATRWERETPDQYLGRFHQHYQPEASRILTDGTISPANRRTPGYPDPRAGLVERGDTMPAAAPQMPQRGLGQPDRSGTAQMTPEQMKEYLRVMEDPSYIPPPPFGSALDPGVPDQTQGPGRPASAAPSGPSSAPAPAPKFDFSALDSPQLAPNDGWRPGPDPRAGLVEKGDTMPAEFAPPRGAFSGNPAMATPDVGFPEPSPWTFTESAAPPGVQDSEMQARIVRDTQAKQRPYMTDMNYLIDRDTPRYDATFGDVRRVEGRDAARPAGPPDIFQGAPQETSYFGLGAKYPPGAASSDPALVLPEAATLTPGGTVGPPQQVDPAAKAAIQYHMADPNARAILDDQQRQEVRQRLMSQLSPPAQPKSSGWGNLPLALAAGGAIGGSAPYTRAYEMMQGDIDRKTADQRYADGMRFKETDNLLGVLGQDSSSRDAPKSTITLDDGTVVEANDYPSILRAIEEKRKRPLADEADQLALEKARLDVEYERGRPQRESDLSKRRAAEDERDATLRAAGIAQQQADRDQREQRLMQQAFQREQAARARAYQSALARYAKDNGGVVDDEVIRKAKAEVEQVFAQPGQSDPDKIDWGSFKERLQPTTSS